MSSRKKLLIFLGVVVALLLALGAYAAYVIGMSFYLAKGQQLYQRGREDALQGLPRPRG